MSTILYQDCKVTVIVNGKKLITGKADYFTIINEGHSFGPEQYKHSYTFGLTLTNDPKKKVAKKKGKKR